MWCKYLFFSACSCFSVFGNKLAEYHQNEKIFIGVFRDDSLIFEMEKKYIDSISADGVFIFQRK